MQDFAHSEDLGSELGKGIKLSRCSVVVFSKDYASSKWCLDELVFILKQKETSGHVLIPVLYNVERSQVRKQTDSFAEAFTKHEQRFKREAGGMDKVEGCREALRKVTGLGMMSLKNDADG